MFRQRRWIMTAFATLAVTVPGCASSGGGGGWFGSRQTNAPMYAQQGMNGPVAASPQGWPTSKGNQVSSPAFGQNPPSSLAAQTSNNISNSFHKATTAVGNALTINPKVIPATDPLSLSSGPTKIGPELYLHAAAMYEANGDVEGAGAQYRKAMEAAPKNVNALLAYARFVDRHGQQSQATKLYQQALRIDPKSAAAHNDFGLFLARQQSYDEALRELNAAVTNQPEKKLYRNNLATVCFEAGKLDEALAHLTTANGPAIAHYNLGYMLYQRKRHDEAINHFRQAAQLNPQLAQAQQMLDTLSGASTQLASQARTGASAIETVAQPTLKTMQASVNAAASAFQPASGSSLPKSRYGSDAIQYPTTTPSAIPFAPNSPSPTGEPSSRPSLLPPLQGAQ